MTSLANPATAPMERRTPRIAKMMKVEMRDLKSPEVQAASDDELKKIITDGKGKMKAPPAFRAPQPTM